MINCLSFPELRGFPGGETLSAKSKIFLGILGNLGWAVTLKEPEPDSSMNLLKYLIHSLAHRRCSISSMIICLNEMGETIIEKRAPIQVISIVLWRQRIVGNTG